MADRVFLGRDGVSSDETATLYYWDRSKHQLIEVLWGKESINHLPWVELFRLRDLYEDYIKMGDDLSLDRAREVVKLTTKLRVFLETQDPH